ncbi:hypothetical protein NOM01_11120 [Sporolactobacillus sp. STSJ-5]|uniref:hypothetical protein n=1 Tax=Sporolactobacillus sp. STSJ-5 TaxID=2965076 RepID=UPI0021037B71|nr:hypothetical protein [Sporolactobacillus sp. STSJ-5]MCQ2010567.1 hypothetical protein [Sporolactobacillus sp. STSJ-5]
MTKDQLIKWLQEDDTSGETPVYMPTSIECDEYTEIEDTGHDRVGTLENPQIIIVLYPWG